jgi:hypothetical protein
MLLELPGSRTKLIPEFMQTESHLSEAAVWANALAARLKVLQASFADDDPATRRGFIVDEINRALKGCVPEKRKALLDALGEQFPSWQSAAPSAPPAPAAEAPAPEPETPEVLLKRLIESLPALSGAQREEFARQLKQAGLELPGGGGGGGGAFEITPDMQKRLGPNGTKPVSVERAAKSLAMQFDMVVTLDQLVWTLWKQIAGKSMVRKEADFAKLFPDYLSGSTEVSSAQLQQSLERTRKLIAGLLGAIGRAGAAYARDRARLFDPAAIEADARAEKKWNESLEFACWRKYVQLQKEYGSEATVEKSIQEAMAKAAENLILGRVGT